MEKSSGGSPSPEGTYVLTGMEMGEPMPEDFFSKAPEADRIFKFSGNTLTATKGGKDDTVDIKYDTTKPPAHFTTTEKKPSGTTETMVGIYKIEETRSQFAWRKKTTARSTTGRRTSRPTRVVKRS